MAPRAALAVVLVGLLGLSACGGADDGVDALAGARPAALADLRGRTFLLTGVIEGGTEHPVASVEVPTRLVVDDGGFHLWGDCNDLVVVDYQIDREGQLTISAQGGPQHGCPAGPGFDQGRRLDRAVRNGAIVTVDDGDVAFSNDGVRATFSPP